MLQTRDIQGRRGEFQQVHEGIEAEEEWLVYGAC